MKKTMFLSSFILLSILSLFIGVHSIPITAIFHMDELQKTVFFHTRLPRTISLVLAGAILSICGLIMQQLTQNRFVSPSTTGTMDSARLGMLVVMLFLPNANPFVKTLVAFVFGFIGSLLFLRIIQKIPQVNSTVVPLVGLMYGNVVGAIVTFIAYRFQLLQNLSAWLQGNFATVTTGSYELLFLSIPLLLITYSYAHHFTIASLGSDLAQSVGLSYQRVRLLGLLIVASASSIVLVSVGNIPFLGIIVPNIVVLFLGDNLHDTLWVAAISGSFLLLACDILARVLIAPFEIPVSVIMGIFGSILFIYILLKGGRG